MSVASPILVGFIKGGGVWKVERCGVILRSYSVLFESSCHIVIFFVIARCYRNICTHNKQL